MTVLNFWPVLLASVMGIFIAFRLWPTSPILATVSIIGYLPLGGMVSFWLYGYPGNNELFLGGVFVTFGASMAAVSATLTAFPKPVLR